MCLADGPKAVVDLTAIPDRIIGVRWQGRNLQIRVQDCRRALAFMFAPIFFGGGSSPMKCSEWQPKLSKDVCVLDGSENKINGLLVKATRNFPMYLLLGCMWQP